MLVCVFHGICCCNLVFVLCLVSLAMALLRRQSGYFDFSKLIGKHGSMALHTLHLTQIGKFGGVSNLSGSIQVCAAMC